MSKPNAIHIPVLRKSLATTCYNQQLRSNFFANRAIYDMKDSMRLLIIGKQGKQMSKSPIVLYVYGCMYVELV